MINLEKVRTEAAQVPDSRLKSETRARMRRHPPRERGKWLSAGLLPAGTYALEIWGDAAFRPKQLLALLVALLDPQAKPRAASGWKGNDDPTIRIPTGLSTDARKPDEIHAAQRMLLTVLILLDHLDPAATDLCAEDPQR